MLIELVGKLEDEAAELKNQANHRRSNLEAPARETGKQSEEPMEPQLEAPPRPTGDASAKEEERDNEPVTGASSGSGETGDIWEGESTGKDYEIVTYHRKPQSAQRWQTSTKAVARNSWSYSLCWPTSGSGWGSHWETISSCVQVLKSS